MIANAFCVLLDSFMSMIFRIAILLIPVLLLFAGCGLITKPISLATKAVVTPVKAVAGVTADVVGRPIRKTAQFVKPVTPVIQIR